MCPPALWPQNCAVISSGARKTRMRELAAAARKMRLCSAVETVVPVGIRSLLPALRPFHLLQAFLGSARLVRRTDRRDPRARGRSRRAACDDAAAHSQATRARSDQGPAAATARHWRGALGVGVAGARARGSQSSTGGTLARRFVHAFPERALRTNKTSSLRSPGSARTATPTGSRSKWRLFGPAVVLCSARRIPTS